MQRFTGGTPIPGSLHPLDGHARATSAVWTRAGPQAMRVDRRPPGYDWIVVEDGRGGPVEVEVAAVRRHQGVVLTTPAGGDGVQAARRGLLEISGDVIRSQQRPTATASTATVRDLPRDLLELAGPEAWGDTQINRETVAPEEPLAWA